MPSVCFHPLEVNLAACAEHGGSASPMVRDDVPGTVQAAGQVLVNTGLDILAMPLSRASTPFEAADPMPMAEELSDD